MEDGLVGQAVNQEEAGYGEMPLEVLDGRVVDKDGDGREGFHGPDPDCCWS